MALTVNVTNSLFNPGSESVGDDHMQPKLSNFFEFSVREVQPLVKRLGVNKESLRLDLYHVEQMIAVQ
jgi:hypothetical protein